MSDTPSLSVSPCLRGESAVPAEPQIAAVMTTAIWANGALMAFDRDDKQIGEVQGFARPDRLERLLAACGPDTEYRFAWMVAGWGPRSVIIRQEDFIGIARAREYPEGD